MSMGLIRQSLSEFVALVLSAKKPDGGIRFCINNRDINSKTITHWYPLPMIKETLNHLGKARIYIIPNV